MAVLLANEYLLLNGAQYLLLQVLLAGGDALGYNERGYLGDIDKVCMTEFDCAHCATLSRSATASMTATADANGPRKMI